MLTPCPGTDGTKRKAYKPWKECVLLHEDNVDGQYLQLAWPEAGGEHVTGSKTRIKDPKIELKGVTLLTPRGISIRFIFDLNLISHGDSQPRPVNIDESTHINTQSLLILNRKGANSFGAVHGKTIQDLDSDGLQWHSGWDHVTRWEDVLSLGMQWGIPLTPVQTKSWASNRLMIDNPD